jgi:hypothetical protein
MTGQFDRIGDGEMVESKNRSRFEAAESADSVEGYAARLNPTWPLAARLMRPQRPKKVIDCSCD